MCKHKLVVLIVLAALLLPLPLSPTSASAPPALDRESNGRAILDSTIYVDVNAEGTGDGSSWVDAFTDLQEGLAAAIAGDEVWVAQGNYLPTAGITRTISFQLVSGVAIYGGFPSGGGDGTFAARDFDLYLTVLNGDIGTPGDSSDNSIHVVDGSGTDGTAVLDGFTVTGGYANGSNPMTLKERGWSICSKRQPEVRNCIFDTNRASYGGGGLYSKAVRQS